MAALQDHSLGQKTLQDQSVYSDHAGDVLEFTFEGTGLTLNGNWIRDGGKADIYIDGEFQRTIDSYFYYSGQEHYNMNLWHVFGLKSGMHTLRLVVKGEKKAGVAWQQAIYHGSPGV